MSPLSSLRSHLLTSGALAPPPPDPDFRGPGARSPDPTAAPQLRIALRQPERAEGAEQHLGLVPPTSAEAAAEAARRAYISASIAAGVNPLPLQGR